MRKTPLIIATAIVGSLTLASFAPAAFAFGGGNGSNMNDGGNHNMQQMFNQMHKQSHAQAQQRGGKGMAARGGAGGGFMKMVCSSDGAAKIEKGLSKMSERLELTDEQKLLFNNLKTASLSAQTAYADNCTTPDKNKDADFIDRIKTHQTNASARITAVNEVLPELEVFFDSLSDEQKAKLKKGKGGPRGQGNN